MTRWGAKWISTTVGQVALTMLSELAGAFLRKGKQEGAPVRSQPHWVPTGFIDCEIWPSASLGTWIFTETQRQHILLLRIPEKFSTMLLAVSGL